MYLPNDGSKRRIYSTIKILIFTPKNDEIITSEHDTLKHLTAAVVTLLYVVLMYGIIYR